MSVKVKFPDAVKVLKSSSRSQLRKSPRQSKSTSLQVFELQSLDVSRSPQVFESLKYRYLVLVIVLKSVIFRVFMSVKVFKFLKYKVLVSAIVLKPSSLLNTESRRQSKSVIYRVLISVAVVQSSSVVNAAA